MSAPELSRIVKVRPHPRERMTVEASEAECAALAARLGVVAVRSLRAELTIEEDGDAVTARGPMTADLVQSCAVSGDDFPVRVAETLALRFVPQVAALADDEEMEFAADDPDEIEFDGESFDLGEAVAQSLALAIDPYAEGPNADVARREAGIVDEDAPKGALADALRALRPD